MISKIIQGYNFVFETQEDVDRFEKAVLEADIQTMQAISGRIIIDNDNKSEIVLYVGGLKSIGHIGELPEPEIPFEYFEDSKLPRHSETAMFLAKKYRKKLY